MTLPEPLCKCRFHLAFEIIRHRALPGPCETIEACEDHALATLVNHVSL